MGGDNNNLTREGARKRQERGGQTDRERERERIIWLEAEISFFPALGPITVPLYCRTHGNLLIHHICPVLLLGHHTQNQKNNQNRAETEQDLEML